MWEAHGSLPEKPDHGRRILQIPAMDHTQAHSPFPQTRWTAIAKIRRPDDSRQAQQALSELCSAYWYPLYAFARRLGRSAHDAQDLTQGFFGYVVNKNLFADADQELGKLRTFLLTAFKRFIKDAQDKEHALKRGGGVQVYSLNADEAEEAYAREPADNRTPESVFERTWALSVLKSALKSLADIEEKAGRGGQFQALEPFLAPDSKTEPDTAAAAQALGTTEENVRQLVSRLRKKFRDMLRQHVADTLKEPSEKQVDEELHSLRVALHG